jgi:hypothetical protein
LWTWLLLTHSTWPMLVRRRSHLNIQIYYSRTVRGTIHVENVCQAAISKTPLIGNEISIVAVRRSGGTCSIVQFE